MSAHRVHCMLWRPYYAFCDNLCDAQLRGICALDSDTDNRCAVFAQLHGQNLVPFYFDKQTLLLETLHDIWMCVLCST